MSGYDLDNRNPFSLMSGRLGIYGSDSSKLGKVDLEGLGHQSMRINQSGGKKQQDRMIADKRRTLERVTQYSYQGADVRRLDADHEQAVRALINPNKVKQDYDDKVISIKYDYDFKVGDIFEWVDTNTYWLIYLQDLTELAYFRGDIRRCNYEISWEDENGEIQSSYISLKGPQETKIDNSQKHKISIDSPNHTLEILLPRNKATVDQFKRYSKFYLQDEFFGDICWRVEGVDGLSSPGILQIHAVEYYANEHEDDIENGIVGKFTTKKIDPNPVQINQDILGSSLIKPRKSYEYIYQGDNEAEWFIDNKKLPIGLKAEGKRVELIWNSSYSGKFNLCYGDLKKAIIVESLF